MDFHEVHDFAVLLAKESGKIMQDAIHEKRNFSTKSNSADLVTETDLKVEKFLRDSIAKKYPTHRFIGEESCYSDGSKSQFSDDPTWIVDPVDGTTNFVHLFPFYCVSIGVTYKKESVVGVVYSPPYDLLYTAIKGGGAYLNKQPIKVSNVTELNQALLMFEFGSSREEEELKIKMDNVHELTRHSHGVRSLGSAAMNMSSVASGSADAYVESGIHCWDMAAAALIITEAGGVVMDTTGGPFDLMSRRILCGANRELCLQMIPLLKQLQAKRDDQ